MAPKPAPARLLAWYRAHRRDLPWRSTREPYAIWVSEVMLQQTRVETVIPYYERFLERFPGVEQLAAADEEEVLAAWSGLGYYRRARQLHRAAREVVASGGDLPITAAGLRRLPGIGEYTAAAIASIAFGEAVPTLDGNVLRLTSRLTAEAGDVRRAAVRRGLAEVAAGLLDPVRPGESNQAMMELGATVCRPRAPRCLACPLGEGCRALAGGDPERFPVAGGGRPTEKVFGVAAVVETEGRVLLARRSAAEAFLPGIWEVPWVVESRSPAAAAALAGRYGGEWRLGEPLGKVRHGITWRDLEIEVRPAHRRSPGGVAEGPEMGWFARSEMESLPTSSLLGKILRLTGA